MIKRRSSKHIHGLVLGLGLALVTAIIMFSGRQPVADVENRVAQRLSKAILSDELGPQIEKNQYPERLAWKTKEWPDVTAKVRYSLDQDMQSYIEKWVRRYGPDYAALVAMDARTGEILSMVSYARNEQDRETNWALVASYPSASLFKIITAGAAIDLEIATPETVVPFNGRNHTLYKTNVFRTSYNRWTKYMTLREAFSRSVNTYFGKLGLFQVGAESLIRYAERFKFNQRIRADVPVQMGRTSIPFDEEWGVVEAASGFTRESTISPVQAAMMAAGVVNDGIMMEPYMVSSLEDVNTQEIIYEAQPKISSLVMKPESAASVRELMHETVRRGTSRKQFRDLLRKKKFSDVEFGGKTGSLTGTEPPGKTDWFTGYARYKDLRLAVAAVTVHDEYWRVKSGRLVSLYMDEYLDQYMKKEQEAIKAAQSPSYEQAEANLNEKKAAQ